MSFETLIDAEPLLRAIREQGWTIPTPIQVRAIPPATAGKDVVGIAQTGTGKTGAFLLPALRKQLGREGLHTLVLCPTRELAQQVASDARELCRHAELFVGEVVGGESMRRQIRDLRAGVDVLVATPGRLIDHIERGNADLSQVETLVLDEADRMLDMGFRPQIESILREVPKRRQTMLFSATMPNGVHALALRIMNEPDWVEATPPATIADRVEQRVYSVRGEMKPGLLTHLLQEAEWDQVLVFTARKSGADALVARLRAAGIDTAVMHGDRDQKERRQALDAFTEGHVRVLVATDVAQRGLDIEGISHVVNYDVPRNPDDYVHRIGRTGRAGASGTAITFMSAAELAAVKDIERVLGAPLPRISIEEFDYAGGRSTEPARPIARVNRAGGRFGVRRVEDLSPEELQALLRVG